jgi:hypothetical protein
MAEEVNTGGLVRFRYDKGSEAKMSDSERSEIRDAYAWADERKRKEKLKRWIIWVIVGLIVVGGIFLLLR